MFLRFFLAGLVIVTVTAGAVASGALLTVQDWGDQIGREMQPIDPRLKNILDPVPAGEPQTIMLLGSDQRFADVAQGKPSRSDTIILLRLDPDRKAMAVMSIPRDLKVDIPTENGVVSDKINAAYSIGGAKTAVQTVRKLLGVDIHHVVNVNFGGFRRFVNRMGCFYQDVDRRYFNDNRPPVGSAEPYATIDVQPGYQLMCGQDSLDWARFRHLDDDFVRSARQQEFIRSAKDQVSASSILGDEEELLTLFGRYTQTDIDPSDVPAVLGLLKLGYESSKHPIREVPFRAGQDAGNTFVTITPDALRRSVREFLAAPAPAARRRTGSGAAKAPARSARRGLAPGLVLDKVGGEDHTLDLAVKARFPVYYPKARLARAGYASESPRRYELKTRTGRSYPAYRIVLRQGDTGQYYGVQGTTWREPPILEQARERVRMRGRTYRVAYDGRRIRFVAWTTDRGTYWVSNTLSQRLTNRQMLDVGKYLTRVGM